jgi:hypothetical protein
MAGGRGQPSIDMFIENDSFQMRCVSKKLTACELRKEKYVNLCSISQMALA